MRVAALDLGTNSFLCLVVEGTASGISQILSDNVKVVRLGEGVDKNRTFSNPALLRTQKCLEEFKAIFEAYKPDKVLAMATSAARDVVNVSELFQITNSLNIPLKIIPGELEAELTFLGGISALSSSLSKDKNILVVDIGGGSTEYILGQNNKISFAKSFDIGCVRLTEKLISHQPVSLLEQNVIKSVICDTITKDLSHIKNAKVDLIIAVAGTPTALAAAEIGCEYDPDKIEGYFLTKEHLEKWVLAFASTSIEEKTLRWGIIPGRSDVIFVGANILLETLNILDKESLMVSTRGVRFGVALKLLSDKEQ